MFLQLQAQQQPCSTSEARQGLTYVPQQRLWPYLPRRLDSLEERDEGDDAAEQQAQAERPLRVAQVLDSLRRP